MILEKMTSNRGLLLANLMCLVAGILTILYLSNRAYGLSFGSALIVMGVVYFGYKATGYKWLEMAYPFVGVATIFIGALTLIHWVHRLFAFLKT